MVGERMYALQTSDNVVLAALHQQAGRNVTITGTPHGDTIRVSSVVPGHG
jgi:hypothetical protein